ncbi:glutamine synthetase family protein [Roseitranquillus sediminis]|uniref:glutamine synthetase family protein n=1 Tax=Roseitranquillus sediminis TaxID=2809051 RepID=UPI001D0C9ACD|nr:glutamine synthetase family protein [Roseitranquillus sediminis]MBM9593727.1 glutamine synthetase [Roseitranquillus sediminis]
MLANLTMDGLRKAAEAGEIDTVLICMVDMQGRLMGKRLHVSHFLGSGHRESHCCNYLLATDLPMYTVEGYAATSWRKGYGDYVLRPDLDTLRLVPWLDGTAMVLCDVLDHHTHEPVPHSPRQMLKRQLERLEALGYGAAMATELEFFLFRGTAEEIRRGGHKLDPISGYSEDYHIFQTTKEEGILRPLRNHLVAAGIPVEGTKGEAEIGQAELNLRYGEGLLAADYHTIAKHAAKEIAWANGATASFLPKWRADRVGSASHVHLSLTKGGTPAFHDPEAEHGLSATGRSFLAGLLRGAPEATVFLAPYVNSYKRFRKGTFAPTRCVWSVDNRTAGFRLVGEGTASVRIECRIGGSDLNPYLALAALLAAGIAGLEEGLELSPPVRGDAYENAADAPEIPLTLRAATEALRGSALLRRAMGDAVVEHYVRAAEWEQEAFDAAVTDWEIARGFELA